MNLFGQLDEHHAHVLRHGEQHFAQAFQLLRARRGRGCVPGFHGAQALQPCQQLCYVGTKFFANSSFVYFGQASEQRRGYAVSVGANFHQHLCGSQGKRGLG